jgi:translation initiation factor eIF-2B subunit delta
MIDETVEEIRAMQSHSSSVVAVKATRALRELLDREFTSVEAYERTLEHNAGALRRANPSHASLHNAMRGVLDAVVGETGSVDDAKEATARAVDEVVEDIEAGKHRAAVHAAETFTDGETFLTHDYSSTVLEAVRTACAEGADLTAYCTEARPRYLGRKAVRELAGIDGVETHLMVDGAAGIHLSEVDRVVLGMTCIVNQRYYNRVGTFPIVAAAQQEDVPVTVVGSGAKIIEDGFQFENEHRSPVEVLLEPAEGFEIENPAYDETPVELIDRVITDHGVRTY